MAAFGSKSVTSFGIKSVTSFGIESVTTFGIRFGTTSGQGRTHLLVMPGVHLLVSNFVPIAFPIQNEWGFDRFEIWYE